MSFHALLRQILVSAATLALFVQLATAGEYVLFQAPGVPADNYDAIVAGLKKDDVLVFSDGVRFTLRDKVGIGGTCRIFRTEQGEILRIARNRWNALSERNILDAMLRGYPDLRDHHVNIPSLHLPPGVDPARAKGTEYIRENEVGIVHSLDRLPGNLDPRVRRQMREAFLELARSTADFTEIADFRPSQLVWDGKRWVLLDWLDGHGFAASGTDPWTVFHKTNYVPSWQQYLDPIAPGPEREAEEAVRTERSRLFAVPGRHPFLRRTAGRGRKNYCDEYFKALYSGRPRPSGPYSW